MVRVLMVAEVRLYRDGLATLLAAQAGIEVIGKARRWQDAVPLVAELRPDIVLIDVPFAEKGAAVRQLAVDGASPVRVVAISIDGGESDVVSWAEAGVAGFVTRDDSLADLIKIVKCVANDEMPCSPRIAATLLRRVGVLAANRSESEERLTSREFEIVTLIERGLSNKQIGHDLCIQLATVKNHVHNILEKLQVSRREDAVALVRGRVARRASTQRPVTQTRSRT
jgi:two-component system, NarL family, nitrate/nitrite response regulator NarL